MAFDATPTSLPASSIRWYLNRLRCMPPAEIPFRVRRALAARVERLRPRGHEVPVPDTSVPGARWISPRPGVEAGRYLEAATRIAQGRLDIFALRDFDYGTTPRWNRDPKTGIEAALEFGKLLDYRDPALVGDIKYLWEPNRHLHLVTLAQAHALGGTGFREALFAQLRSWIDACPCGLGPNWSSALEPAIRLINWSLAWQLLGGADGGAFRTHEELRLRDDWLRSVYQHVRFVRGFHSLHSSANNHLIGEAAGVYVAALTWPYWDEAGDWARQSRQLLVREALRQNAPDGVNREQAVCYQQFEFDLLLAAWLAGRAAGSPFPDEFTARLEAMLEYLASIMDRGGNVPMFGDSDDGRAMCLSQEPGFSPYRSLLATGAVLFGRGDFRQPAVELDDKTRWLCGPGTEARFASLHDSDGTPVRRAFPEGGCFILGCDYGRDTEARMVVDAGPLGYGTLAAHGHADALSFTLSLGGHEFLVDPGTCTYRADSPWRAYFRGTAAHNTLRIDGLDQSEAGGSFLWLSKAEAACSKWSSGSDRDLFEGWQDGYCRLPDPVMHNRRILLDKARRRIIIDDLLEMREAHLVELFFHFSEDCRVSAEAGLVTASRDGRVLGMRLPALPQARVQLHEGSEQPRLGWISRGFDSRCPSATVAWAARIRGSARLRTQIAF